MVRDGLYVTDNDIRMHLHGVYHKEAGRLEAVLEPLSPIQMDITNADQTEENSDYRRAPVPLVQAAMVLYVTSHLKVACPWQGLRLVHVRRIEVA